jgi:hypothetical protein
MRMPTPLWNLRSAVSSLLINHAMADFLGGKPLSCEIPLEGVVSTAGKLMLKSVQARIDGRKDEGSASGYEKKTAVSSLIVNAQFSDEEPPNDFGRPRVSRRWQYDRCRPLDSGRSLPSIRAILRSVILLRACVTLPTRGQPGAWNPIPAHSHLSSTGLKKIPARL